MAAKRIYTESDRAAAFAALTVNEGNVKRTARETEIPEQTVRDWKKVWESKGLPATVEEALPEVVEDMGTDLKRVRDKILAEIELQVDAGMLKGAALVTAYGILFDKTRVLDGLATSRKEVVNTGPSPEETGAAILDYMNRTLAAGLQRDEEIEDAEWEQAPQGELLAAPSDNH